MNIKRNLNVSQVISRYLAGETLINLANAFSLKSYGPIKRILKENGVALRRKGELRIQTGLPLDVNYFREIDQPEKAYWLGFLTADGYVSPNGYKTTFCLKDKEAVEKFKAAIQSGHAISEEDVFDKRTKKIYRRYVIQITSKHFCHHLALLGVQGRKSFRCEPPKFKQDLFCHYVRGLFDGDGSVCFLKTGKRRVSLIATRPILDMVKQFFVKDMGFSEVKYSIVATEDGHNICKLHIYRKQDQETFFNFIYDNSAEHMRLSRKYIFINKKNTPDTQGIGSIAV
jgi:hypothetical protein